jgi:putative transposase
MVLVTEAKSQSSRMKRKFHVRFCKRGRESDFPIDSNSNCGHRARKALSTRTHSCSNCKIELCRDTNAALNILQKGMNLLGTDWQKNGTSGQEESASSEGKHGENTASTIEGQPDIASGLL